MSERPYARLYLELVDDEKFVGIYEDDHHFAAYCRLLMIAEGAWPASAHLPVTVRRQSVKALLDSGLVDEAGAGRYRIHGLDKERTHRQERARASALSRNRSATALRPLSDRPANRDETSKDEQEPSNDEPWLVAWWQIGRRRMPTEGQMKYVNAGLKAWDVTGPERIARLFLESPDDPIGALKADLDAWREQRAAEARKAEAEAAKPKRRTVELDDFGRALEARAAAQGIRTVTPEEVA